MNEDSLELERLTQSSIELDCNAKGEFSLKAKVYYDEASVTDSRLAQERLEAINEWFQRKFRAPGKLPEAIAPGVSDPRD